MSQDITTPSAATASAISSPQFVNKLVSLLSKQRANDATFYTDCVRLYDALKDRESTLPAALKQVEIDGRSLAKSTFLAWVQVGRFLLTHGAHAPFAMLSQRSLRILCTVEADIIRRREAGIPIPTAGDWDGTIEGLYGLTEPALNATIKDEIQAAKRVARHPVPTTTPDATERSENDTPSLTVQAGKHTAQAVTLSRETLALFAAVADTVPSDGEPLTADDIGKFLATRYLATRKAKTATATAH